MAAGASEAASTAELNEILEHGRVHESVRPWQEVVRLETRASSEQDLLVTRHAARARLAHLSESTAESENKEATLLSARPWLAALCNNDIVRIYATECRSAGVASVACRIRRLISTRLFV